MPIAGNVSEVNAADYAPPAASGQRASGDWFAENAPSSAPSNVSIKTPPKPTAEAPHTISAKKPSFLDRITAPFVGEGTTYGAVKAQREGARWVAGQDPFEKPLVDVNAIKAENLASHPALKGMIRGTEQVLSDFATPRALELAAATGGLSKIPVIGKLLAAGFGIQQIKGAMDRTPELKEKLASGDNEGAAKLLTEMGLGLELGRRAINHAGGKKETVSRPEQKSSASTRPYSADLANSRRISDTSVEVPNTAPSGPRPPNPRKVAPRATVPVEGPTEAEQRADFARAEENMAELRKNGPRRKTMPWETRPLVPRLKNIAQHNEAASAAKVSPVEEPVSPAPEPTAVPVENPAQPRLPLGQSQPIETLPESKAAQGRPVVPPPQPVGSLGLQDAVVGEPMAAPAEKVRVEPVVEPAPQTPTGEPAKQADTVIWKKGDPVPSYSEVVNINPHDLKPDPVRFQYKQDAIGKGGTTDEFRDVKEWDPGLGGALAVWQDPATGEVHPINGHHRTEIAQRTNAPSVNVRFIEAKTPTEARTFGAMLNIGEGKGTSLDAAKLFRDSHITPEDLAKYKISPTSKLAVQGLSLAKLEPTIYRQVVDGKMTPSRGALIGDLLGEDHAAQQAAVDFFKQSDRRGTRYNDAEAADIIRSIKSTPEAIEELPTLFGVDEVRRNLFGERAQVSASIGKRLAREKGLFNLVSKKSNAERLTGAGNILNAEDNQKISQEAAQIMAVYDRLKFSSGPVADALNEAAKQVAEGVDLDVATNNAYTRIKDGVSAILGGGKANAATAGEGTGAEKPK